MDIQSGWLATSRKIAHRGHVDKRTDLEGCRPYRDACSAAYASSWSACYPATATLFMVSEWICHGRPKSRHGDPLLPKPDRALSPPARVENGAGRARSRAVRGCPLRTGQDRCERHGSGTTSERTWARGGAVGSQLDRRVRPVLGHHCFVAKPQTRRGRSSSGLVVVDDCNLKFQRASPCL
jgi:hypothetical protein